MGCCTSKQSSEKKTLKEGASDLKPLENKAEITYQGKKPKDVLFQNDIDDLMLAVKNGSTHLVEAICVKFQILNVCEVRGLEGQFELLKREKYELHNWNMILVAIAFDHLAAVKFFTKQLSCHLRVSVRSPPILGFSKMQASIPEQSESFPLLLAINNQNDEMFKFLWQDLSYLWDTFHLQYVIEEMCNQKYTAGLRILLQSQTAQDIYLSMRNQEKIQFLTELLLQKQTKRSGDVKETLRDEFSKHPYASVSLFVLLTDPKFNFNLIQNHLEKSVSELDCLEFGRFKATQPPQYFGETVANVVSQLVNCEESTAQRLYGDTLRSRMENLNTEIFKQKFVFTNMAEYEAIQNQKLFDMADSGELKDFSQTVIDNDIRFFKRKRQQTVKLTSSFTINNYCYLTPLLVAIQQKRFQVVYFIMEKMKIGLRQALCLQAVDGEESFCALNVPEEYQAYSLLCCAANRDEQMLRLLWEGHGQHLWTERHFEPLLRYLIESDWHDGIRLIFKSEITHQMIKAFSAEERSFFIENMIGDLYENQFEQTKDEVKKTTLRVIKEELTQKPYAGIFIISLVDRFESLSEQELKAFWEPSCDHVYVSELKLLTQVNQSRFSQFILDHGIKRPNDVYKEHALMFIKRLSALAEYEPIIKEGREDAIMNGKEEINFIKRDVETCPLGFYWEFIQHSISGNVKVLERLVATEKLTALDIYDIRGFAVKCFEKAYETKENNPTVMNTREWNPVMYAIYYRQLKVVQYLINEVKVNLKLAIDYSNTYNEFNDDPSYKEIIGSNTYLFGFFLCILTQDLAVLKYLYEEMYDQLLIDDSDIIKVLRMCIHYDWPQGFLTIVTSNLTSQLFINAQLHFKEEFVIYCISENQLESKCINSTRNEDIVKEIKEKMVAFPYCAISWLFIDPFYMELKKDQDEEDQQAQKNPLRKYKQNNDRYIKILKENFAINSVEMLAVCGQIEGIKKKFAKPQINLEFLDMNIQDEKEKQDMVYDHEQQKIYTQKMIDYQSFYVEKVEQWTKEFFPTTKLSDACEEIVNNFLKDSQVSVSEKIKGIDSILKFTSQDQSQGIEKVISFHLLQFVGKYENYSFWRKYSAKFNNIDMDYLNIIHWVLFFNDAPALEHLLTKVTQSKERTKSNLSQLFSGDKLLIKFDYEYIENGENGKDEDQTIAFDKLGLIICVIQKSYACWEMLFSGKFALSGLLTAQEILDTTIMICAENWTEGIKPLCGLIESAFQKVSLIKRINFILKLLRLKNEAFKDVMRIERILTFAEWLYENHKEEYKLQLYPHLKKVLPSYQGEKQRELKKISYLARHKPLVVDAALFDQQLLPQKPNDIINLNDITIEQKRQKKPSKIGSNLGGISAPGLGMGGSGDNDSAEIQSD